MPLSKETVRAARRRLRANDPVMRAIVDRVGPFTLRVNRDRFRMLAGSIISQQISTAAARSIQQRLIDLVGGITPENLARFDAVGLRTAGVSPQKAAYLISLTEHVASGAVDLRQIGRLSDEQVTERLIQIKGVGRWTAKMFLIFALGRPDVLPHDDLGIRNAVQLNYKLPELPDKATCEQIAEPWRPYATIASWYCWRSLELASNS
jgi:DNA-3-methyladenine glycosylase II